MRIEECGLLIDVRLTRSEFEQFMSSRCPLVSMPQYDLLLYEEKMYVSNSNQIH